MFIGLVLIPPLLLKLASASYRMVRYYTGARAYREKGPPALPLRMLAPVLVVATLGIFTSGVALLALGHRSDVLLTVHKASFIVWGVVFAVHFLAYVPRVLQSLRADWGVARRAPGAGRVAAGGAARGGAGRRRGARADTPAGHRRLGRSSGRRMTKRAPPSGDRVTSASPPCASAIARTIASPSPAPPWSRPREASRRAKRSKMRRRSTSGTPGPSSSTTRATRSPSLRSAQADQALGLRVDDRVAQEVAQRLGETVRVGVDDDRPARPPARAADR